MCQNRLLTRPSKQFVRFPPFLLKNVFPQRNPKFESIFKKTFFFSFPFKSDGLLVCGTSLSVYSIFRFIKEANQRSIPLAIVNLGPTRGDSLANLRIEAKTGTILPDVVQSLKLAA